MGMSKERQGEIALALIEHRLKKQPMPAPADFRRELGNLSKDIGVSADDLVMFYETILPKLLGTMLGRSKVSLTTSD